MGRSSLRCRRVRKKKYNASFFVLLSFHDHYQGGFIPRTIIIIAVGSMVLSN